MLINSLKTKLLIFYSFLVLFVVFIKVASLHLIQLPQFYALESLSDQKDISRIKMAFSSKSKEYGVINYDNAVWDETYNYVNNKNSHFTDSNFVIDAFKSLGLNGINIYDKQKTTVWYRAWEHSDWSPISFSPFEQPSDFVKEHILVSDELVSKNDNRPTSRIGFTFLNDKLIIFAATSIFKASLKDEANGTMLFWRFFDNEILTELQERARIKFTIKVIDDNVKNNFKPSSMNSFIEGSYRTETGEIFDVIPLTTGNGSIQFTYQAPLRNFSTSWLNLASITSSALFLLTLSILFAFFHYFIIRPILKADKMVTAIIKHGDHSMRFSSRRKDELGKLFYLIDKLLDGVESSKQQLLLRNKHLQAISQTDSLTKIPNRRAFDSYMNKLLNSNTSSINVSMLVCDVDYFKKYNDFYGHAQGDITLHAIAQALRKNLHEDTDFVARYGGEEFVIVLKNTDKTAAQSVANNLVKRVSNLKIIHEQSEVADVVTISIGIHSFITAEQIQHMSLFEQADQALYQAKEQGRNRAITTE